MSNKNILFRSQLDGTRFYVELLPGQPILRDLDRKPEDLKITASFGKLTRSGIGTVFISSDYTFPEDGHLHINDGAIPLYFDDEVYPLVAGMTEDIKDKLDFLIDWMLEQDDYGLEKAKHYVEQYKPYGLEVDLDAKLAALSAIPEKGEEIAGGPTLRRRIAASYPCPKVEDTGFFIDPELWFLLVRNIVRKENTLLVGPTGSGKTEIMRYLSEAMAMDLSIVDMGTVQDAQSALLGVHRLNNEGHSIFDPAPFIGYIQKPGVVLMDEINRAPQSANNILFPALDSRRYIPLDIAAEGEERHIPVNEETVFFGTANLGSEYSGTNAIDRALLDRFFPVELDYPTEEHEIKALVKRTLVDEKSATAIVKVANNVREMYKKQELGNSISVRHTLQAASLSYDGFDVANAISKTVMPLFEDSCIGTSEREKVKAIISAF